MKEFKGTKAPWHMMVGGFTKTGNIPNLIQIYATNDDLEMVCKVYKDVLLHQKEQNFEANAKLIAAAPDLLEAALKLKEIAVKLWGDDEEKHPKIMDRFEKAINKALD